LARPTFKNGSVAIVADQAINVADLDEAVRLCADAAEQGRGFTLFTLNLDHVVKLRSDAAFQAAYRDATFVTADGAPIVWIGRRQSRRLERATGADLVEPLCAEAARRGVGVHFFGAHPSTLAAAKETLERRHAGLRVEGALSPAMGFDPNSAEAARCGAAIAASGAKICFVALGAPKQELFAAAMARRHPDIGFVCIGAALDFIAGVKPRAPRFMQRHGLEWAWRLASEPSRMAGRYARCVGALAALVAAGPAGPALER
jgi:exopolysaccharide biosynthesis WecB/TagA/CpsF family protein